MQIIYGSNRKAELILTGNANFLIEGKEIKKITPDALVPSTKEEFEKALTENRGKLTTRVTVEIFTTLEKALGKFEIEL